jgi:hypothetical protein
VAAHPDVSSEAAVGLLRASSEALAVLCDVAWQHDHQDHGVSKITVIEGARNGGQRGGTIYFV